MTRDKLIGYKEIAELTGRTANSVRQMAHHGGLPPRATPQYPIWYLQDIKDWIKTDPAAMAKRPPGAPRPGGRG